VDEDRERYVEDVLVVVETIPPGKVATYGDIATYVGRGGPRQVGAVMREHGAAVAWWRVLRASGIPTEELARRQLMHLLDEGVPATNGRVNLWAYRWTP
jgi:alkylated DNA nucleotide flippase Atl1